jgi:hypothetical protein
VVLDDPVRDFARFFGFSERMLNLQTLAGKFEPDISRGPGLSDSNSVVAKADAEPLTSASFVGGYFGSPESVDDVAPRLVSFIEHGRHSTMPVRAGVWAGLR